MAFPPIHLIDGVTLLDESGNSYVVNLGITQGETYTLSFYLEGKYDDWTITSIIRDERKSTGSPELTRFTWDISYEASPVERTFFVGTLSDTDTAGLTVTTYQGRQTLNEKNCLVFDIELESPLGVVEKTDLSFIQVKPEVT